MKYSDLTLRQTLAGEYALGALHGAARARFERLLRRDPALQALVYEWQQLLSPLAQETPAVAPPARVLAAIERRIGAETAAARPGFRERLGWWRAFSSVATAAAVVLALTTTLLVLRPPAAVPPSYVAILQDHAAQPALAVTAYKQPWRINVETLATASIAEDQVLQVWAVEKDSGVTRPLIAFTPGKAREFALSEEGWKLVRTAHSLVVSVEPATTVAVRPTTPLLYSGLCINLKGG
jgi:anti-sigma-K factor RskA